MKAQIRERQYLNNGWRFSHVWSDDMIEPAFADQTMEEARLPHTNVLIPFNYGDDAIYQERMGYRLHFTAKDEWKGKKVLLTFEGIAHQATVFLNGREIGFHNTGYTAFTMDITDVLTDSDNIISVKVDSHETLNTPPFGHVIDYMTYGGIYREAYLTIVEPTYLKDIYAMPIDVRKNNATLSLDVEVENPAEDMELLLDLGEENILAETRIGLAGASTHIEIPTSGARHWDVEDPYLYDLHVTLLSGGKEVDDQVIRIGFRRADFRENGFFLNGRKLKIRGLDRHQSYPYVGYAMPESMQKMDAEVLKNELGLNAVRTSHYPQSHHFLDRCDELGLLVFTEMPGWQHIGDEAWKDQAVQNVEEMVVEYRNHPSIILWGVRINESQDDDAFYERTNAAAHRLDPYRQTGGVRYLKKSHLLEDVYTYNDFIHTGDNRGVDKKKDVTPDITKGYLVSEYNGHMYPTKTFDDEPHRKSHALRHAKVINDVAGEKDIAGSFGWCMADYHTHQDFGSGDRICYHGVLDMFRNPKMAAAVYESQISPEIRPVLSVSSSMDIGDSPAGFLGPVTVFTNAEKVVFYKNGEKIQEFYPSDTNYPYLTHPPIEISDFIGDQLETKEHFSPAQARDVKKVLVAAAKYGQNNLPAPIKVLAGKLMLQYQMTMEQAVELYGKYIGNWGGKTTTYRFDAVVGNRVVASVIRGAVKEIRLVAESDVRPMIEGNTYDVREIRLNAVDQYDNVLPYYQEPLVLSVTGPAEIIGPSIISLKGGLGGTYIRTIGEAGTVVFTVSGDRFEAQQIVFRVEKH